MYLATLQAPGAVTYQTIVCPVCGATLRAGYQALAPQYLIANATCPFCGTVVAHNVVSLDVVSAPAAYYPAQATGTNWTSMFAAMMPMLMMVMMMAMLMPMMKGMTAQAK